MHHGSRTHGFACTRFLFLYERQPEPRLKPLRRAVLKVQTPAMNPVDLLHHAQPQATSGHPHPRSAVKKLGGAGQRFC